jgi:two-component SAPR family response regulator
MLNSLEDIIVKRQNASLQVQTLGNFQVWRDGVVVSSKEWGRDKTIQLMQFFVTARHRKALHKEHIMDRLWNEDIESGDPYFKVALHGITKILEPHKKSHADAHYITRQGITYKLNLKDIWIDADALEAYIALGNQVLNDNPQLAKQAYYEAIQLYEGVYLPDRLYEDWSSDERERLQVLALGAIITYCELILLENPMEAIRLAQQALIIDPAWEDAYRLQMAAYFQKGNRPMAIKTYLQCEKVLEEEFGIEPLPETKLLLKKIKEA